MRVKAVTADGQYRLIMECRASGMTDYQWCMASNIKPGTFYNWVRRLRQSGNMDVFCQALFPEKSVKIPFFRTGNFPAFGETFSQAS